MIQFLNPDRLDKALVDSMNAYLVYLLARFPGAAIVVHEDFAGVGHVSDSQHYLGKAVDFHVVNVPLTEAWLGLERFPTLAGIGFYPDWKNVGFHADTRVKPYRERWMRRGAEAYVAFDKQAMALMLAIEPKIPARV